MEITREKLQAELADLARNRQAAFEMVLRYDGAMQATEGMIAYLDQPTQDNPLRLEE